MNEHVNKALQSALTKAREDLYQCELHIKRAPEEARGLRWRLERRASLQEQIAALEAELAK